MSFIKNIMETDRLFIGFDVGLTGAIAILDDELNIVYVAELENINSYLNLSSIIDIFLKHKNNIKEVYIEHAQSMPKQGIASTFKYGVAFGEILGLTKAFLLPYQLIKPQAWKKIECAGMPKDKASSIVKVSQLYPAFVSKFKILKRHHNICDAILICRYGIKTKK